MFANILQLLMIIGPVLGYFDQIYKFRKAKSSKGFSLDTSGILLISSIIRIYFWIGKRFDDVLLYQSIFMILTQLLVLHQAIKYRINIPSIFNRSQREFWNWYTLAPYLKFLASLTGTLFVLSYLFIDKHWFVELLGFLALGIESAVPMPQAWKNFQSKSIAGFSPIILLVWFTGDAFKIFYYTYTFAPFQFVLCGAIQLAIDTIIVFQFFTSS